MNRHFLLTLMTLIAFSLVLSHAAPRAIAQTAANEDPLVQLVRDWLAAESRNDRAALDTMIDGGFVGTAFGGNIVSKDDIVPSATDPASNRFPKSSLKEATSRRFGDTGVVMALVALDNPQNPGEFRCTIVFQEHGDSWKMIAAHLSR